MTGYSFELAAKILALLPTETGNQPLSREQIADFFRTPVPPPANASPRVVKKCEDDGAALIAKVVEEACMKAGCKKTYDKLKDHEKQAVIAAIKSHFLDESPQPLAEDIAKKLTNRSLQVVPFADIVKQIGAAITSKRGMHI